MLLLQHGADVDAATKDMYSPLHIAAKEGQDEVRALLRLFHLECILLPSTLSSPAPSLTNPIPTRLH